MRPLPFRGTEVVFFDEFGSAEDLPLAGNDESGPAGTGGEPEGFVRRQVEEGLREGVRRNAPIHDERGTDERVPVFPGLRVDDVVAGDSVDFPLATV